jgi:hypothetical protein
MNQELKTIKLIGNGQQYVLPYEETDKGEKKSMTTQIQTQNKTETVKKEVEYQKAGWINKSKSGQALTFKIGEHFYSVPISSVKDLLSTDKSGVTFSEVISKA